MSLILVITLLVPPQDGGVFPAPASLPTAVEVARKDLEFTRGVEESIAREPRTRIPEGYAGLIGLLGCDSWRGREDATIRLESTIRNDPGSIRWLFWGRLHRDPEVRHRANCLIKRLNPCPTCGGTGRSKSSFDWPCGDCKSWDSDLGDYLTLSAWPYSPWD